MMRTLKHTLIVLALVALATPSFAGIQARMQGQIIDSQGKPIPHASVTKLAGSPKLRVREKI
mgnify:CR=1 FL=1